MASTEAVFSVNVEGAPTVQAAGPIITRMSAILPSPETWPILLYKLLAMGHLDSQRPLPVFGEGRSGISSTAKKLRLAAGQKVAILNAPQGYTAQISPALRFKRG